MQLPVYGMPRSGNVAPESVDWEFIAGVRQAQLYGKCYLRTNVIKAGIRSSVLDLIPMTTDNHWCGNPFTEDRQDSWNRRSLGNLKSGRLEIYGERSEIASHNLEVGGSSPPPATKRHP